MKQIILIMTLILVSCGKSDTPSTEVHQDTVNASKNIFNNGKVVFPANKFNPNNTALLACALDYEGKKCSPGKTPLIGMKHETITPEIVLSHTLLSHDFLKKPFETFLKNTNNKYLLPMFSSVSGIVLTDEVSSSFYLSRTGMIYIDARYLWQNQQEYSKLKLKKDPRGETHPDKKIEVSHTYLKNGKPYNNAYRSTTRTTAGISKMLTRLMFHELSHAMDYFPPATIKNLPKDQTYNIIAYEKIQNKEISSDKLGYAENIHVWSYAQFYFYNELTGGVIPSLTMDDFLDYFVNDNSITFYSYTTKREHLAMLTEAYMMVYAEKYQECTRAWKKNGQSWKVFWGQRNRILQPSVLNEAKDAIKLIFKSEDSNSLLSIPSDFLTQIQENPVHNNVSCF